MSNPDIQPHELAAMRQTADKAPFDIQRKFHVLLDAYEEQEKVDAVKGRMEDAEKALREVRPDDPAQRWKSPEAPLSKDAWTECLEDCRTPEERTATVEEELERARAAEVELRARLEALEEAIDEALDELKA